MLEEQQGGNPDAVIEIRTPRDLDINEYLIGVIEDGKVFVKEGLTEEGYRSAQTQAQLAGQPSEEGGLFGSSFLNEDGTTAHPILTDILPVGAEDIHHPETREFIAQEWVSFINEFDQLSEPARHQRLQSLVREWERAYKQKWDSAAMSGMMTAIRQLAARSALTAWLKKNPDVNILSLIRYGASMNATQGDVSPHLAKAAEYVANVYPEDVVRVDDAGDGLIAAFLGDKARSVEFVESTPLRRAIFNQLNPESAAVSEASAGMADVLFTSNSNRQSPSDLLNSVNRGGRLVIYGDSDWHHISAYVIEKMELYEGVDEYVADLPDAMDESSRAKHAQIFVAWKKLGRNIPGRVRYLGSGSAYASETGALIVVDNIDGNHVAGADVNLANLQPGWEQGIEAVPGYNAIREARYSGGRDLSRPEMLASRERAASQAQRKEQARERATAAVNNAMNTDRAQIFPNHPDIEMRVLGIGQQLKNEGIIPRGTEFNSIEELAVIADVARNPSMVNTQVLLVRDGVVEASVLGGVRMGEDVRPNISDVQDMIPYAQAEEYDVVAVVNRPSGDTSIEENDRTFAAQLNNEYPKFKYLLIKNGDTYSAIVPDPNWQTSGERYEIRENVPLMGQAQRPTPADINAPSWVAQANPTAANAAVSAMHADFDRIHSEHIHAISQMVGAQDDWVVAAVLNQDGSLADMVSIPNAFDLDAEGASRAIGSIRRLYGGADTYLFLASSGQITHNGQFFENTGWGQYLSGEPAIRGHVLVGAGSVHAANRIKSYPLTAQSPGEMRTLAKSVAPTASKELPQNLAKLIGTQTQGNVWEQAKALFVQTLGRDLTRTQPLTAIEEAELRNQINLATSYLLKSRRIMPEVANREEAETAFKTIEREFKKWHEKTTSDLNGEGLSITPQHAYLMHYLANAAEGDVVVIPDAGQGMLAAYAPYQSHVLLTEPDATRRSQIQEVLNAENINEASSHDLAAYWQQSPELSENRPHVVLLDSREPEAFWRQLNQALHTVGDNGRVVAHINLEMEAEAVENFRESFMLNAEALTQHYRPRMQIQHDGRLILVVDRGQATEGDTVISKSGYDTVEELMADAEAVRISREGAPIPESPAAPAEEVAAADTGQVEAEEAVEEKRHTKPQPLDINKEETHREWTERVQVAVGDRYDVSSPDGARALYDNMMAMARTVPTHNGAEARPENDVRGDISAVWDSMIGFTPGTGWERFLMRLTAASMSINYDPDMVYRLKLHELLDAHAPRDIEGTLDGRTDEVDTRISVSYRISHKKPVKIYGEKIADAEDAAILFQPFRNHRYEQAVFMGVNEQGEVVKTIPLTAQNGFGVQSVSNYEIQRLLANNPEIKGFWVAHNHPESITEFGDEDFMGEFRLRNRFGNIFKGMIATDTGEFSAIVDGDVVYHREEFSKPIDEVYLQRPTETGVLGTRVAGMNPDTGLIDFTDPAYIAGISQEVQRDLTTEPDLVTFVFVAPEMTEPGGDPEMLVVGTETHKNIHGKSPDDLYEMIRGMNTEHGAFHTYMIVSNPSDAANYGEGSSIHNMLMDTSRQPVVYGTFVETEDRNFPFKNNVFDVGGPVASGFQDATGTRQGLIGLDDTTGDVINPRKQRKFTEFLLFEYLAHDEPINWEAARTYANRYFGTTLLTDGQLRQMGEIAFDEYLHVQGIQARLTEDNIDLEAQYLIVDNLYRRLVDPESTPSGAPATVEAGHMSNTIADYLAALMLNVESGETFEFVADHHKDSPLAKSIAEKGVHVTSENVDYPQYNRNLKDADGNDRVPTAIYDGIAFFTAKGGNEGTGEDPFASIRYKLHKLAPRGRAVFKIEGGSFDPMDDNIATEYSGFTGTDGIPFNVPLLSKVITAYVAERAGEISIEERNQRWGLSQDRIDYYHGMLGEIFNTNRYSVRGFIRTGEHRAHLVIDKVPETGEHGTALSVDPRPDIRTLVEEHTKLRLTRPKVSSRHMRAPSRESTQPMQHPRRMSEQSFFSSPIARQTHAYQAEMSARTGSLAGAQRSISFTDSEYGRQLHVGEEGSTLGSPHRQSRYPQIVVSGLDRLVDRQTLQAMFASHGEVINVVMPQNYEGNAAIISMRNQPEADAAIKALNDQMINGARVSVKQTDRDSRLPSETLPTGNPDSMLAWDVALRSPFLPDAIRRKWMATFDIASIEGRDGKTTYLRKDDSNLYKKFKQRKNRMWAGRVGQWVSRPIDHIQRWNEPGRFLAELMTNTYYEAHTRGGDVFEDVMGVYNSLRLNPAVSAELRKGSTEKILSSQMGFLPLWLKRVPGIRAWIDEEHEVERAVDKDGNILTHQAPDGRWVTEIFMDNAPLLDAWVNSYFVTQSDSIFPKNPEVRRILRTELEKVRDGFDRLDQEVIDANHQILRQDLLTSELDAEDITDALANNDLDKDSIRVYAERFGITLPNDFDVYSLQQRGTMRQWVITPVNETRELYRIRQFDPQESIMARLRHDPDFIQHLSPRERQRHANSLTLYQDFIGKTLIYEAKPRNPVWTKKNGVPYQMFAGRPHDMPRMVNWAGMNPHADVETEEFKRYLDYKDMFYEINASAHKNDPNWTYNGKPWTPPLADAILKEHYNGFNNMRYDPLEDDSELIYPSVAYESQSVLGEYSEKAGQRVTEILNYGQDADLLKIALDELQNPENMELDDLSKAVLKLRRAIGHDDFSDSPDEELRTGNIVVPFHGTEGVRRTTRPEFDNMTADDWQVLIDNEIVTLVDNGIEGFYAWADPSVGQGETVRQEWDHGGSVEFEVSAHAGALINYALLNLDRTIDKQIAESKYQYATAKDTMERMHTWHPGMIEIGRLEEQADAIHADLGATRALQEQKNKVNAEFSHAVRQEVERRNNPVYRFLNTLQRLATNLLMRLSWASQFGTFHNPVHRVGLQNFARGVMNDLSSEHERDRMKRLGVYMVDVRDMVGLSMENVSQEKVGFNQKMLGASKYFAMDPRQYGGTIDFLKAFYNRGNWTPFMFVERRLRGTAAAGGKHLVKDALTDLLVPGKIRLTGQQLAARRAQHIHALEELDITIPRLLKTVMELSDPATGKPVRWTEELIDQLTEMGEKQAEDTYASQPHLAAVSKLTDRVMQVMPDYVHYAGSNMHRMRLLDHPFLRIMVLFQTMMIEQTRNISKMLRFNMRMLGMPVKEAAKAAGEDGISIPQALKLTTREMWRMLPHFLFSSGAILGSGFVATILAQLVRGRVPDDEDLAVMTWITNAAVFGAATGYVESAGHYRGIVRQFGGPLPSVAEDFIQNPVDTTGRLVFRPFPIDFRPWFGYWFDTSTDIHRSIAGGGFRPTGGTSLSQVRAP